MKTVLLVWSLLFTIPVLAQESRMLPSNTVTPTDVPIAYAVRNNEVQTGASISFQAGTAILLPASERSLQTIAKYLTDKTSVSSLRIEGHTVCGTGDQALSEARAKAVADWLIAHGTSCSRLLAVGFGCSKPLVADHAEMNERITFVNAALRGHPIAGMPADGGGKRVQVECPAGSTN